MTEPNRSFLDELRDFAAGEAAVLARLEGVLDALRREDADDAGFDSEALWTRLEGRLGWKQPRDPAAPGDQPADGR